jgi:hypothetical protein
MGGEAIAWQGKYYEAIGVEREMAKIGCGEDSVFT